MYFYGISDLQLPIVHSVVANILKSHFNGVSEISMIGYYVSTRTTPFLALEIFLKVSSFLYIYTRDKY